MTAWVASLEKSETHLMKVLLSWETTAPSSSGSLQRVRVDCRHDGDGGSGFDDVIGDVVVEVGELQQLEGLRAR